MKRNFLLSIIILGGTIFLLSGCEKEEPEHYSSDSSGSSIELKEKVQMPVFELPSAKGDILQSKSLQGKTLLVIFFSPICHDCYSFLAQIEKLQGTLAEKGFTVIAIASGEIDSNELAKLHKKINVSYSLLTDRGAKLHKKFGKGILMPLSYLVSKDGKIVKQYLGHMDLQMLTADIEKIF